ncbi:hypothetical protein SAMN06298226_0054 [Nitrosovibrio sp. Nv4]|nr:hypothetical protein SAMN06298226_0054 [Nitrosovibrio sp. Nv4]
MHKPRLHLWRADMSSTICKRTTVLKNTWRKGNVYPILAREGQGCLPTPVAPVARRGESKREEGGL